MSSLWLPVWCEVGEIVTEDSATGFIVRFAVFVVPLQAAEIVTMSVVLTDDVVIVK